MTQLQINDSETLSENQLAEFESVLKKRLPEDYRQFLLQHNGGAPSPDVFFVPEASTHVGIRSFFGIGRSSYESLDNWHQFRKRLAPNLLPIAEDDCGNLVLLSLGPDKGTVYFWDHELETHAAPKFQRNIFQVADTFSDFLEQLEELPEIDMSNVEVLEVWIDPEFHAEQARLGNTIE